MSPPPHPDGPLGRLRGHGSTIVAAAAALGLAAGLVAGGLGGPAGAIWAATTALVLVPTTWGFLRALRAGDIGVDAIAAIAMIGALALGEMLAGAVVALMLAGGGALEEAAGRRARADLALLVGRAPRIAHRVDGERVEEVPVEALAVGDVVVVRPGEVVPVDGRVLADTAVLDESALTGEPLPAVRRRDEPVASGVANAGGPFELRATRPAAESTYARIVRLVRAAEGSRAPFVRLADRYAAWLVPLAVGGAVVAGLAARDPVRGLAVLVVATPCPLILAAPIALVGGVSRAARRGVVVKGAAVVERLGRARTVLLDKTGTLTVGTPEVERVSPRPGFDPDEVLRLAASVEQLSPHVTAEAIVHHAEARGLVLAYPAQVVERPGEGVEGLVDGRRVVVGGAGFVGSRGIDVDGASAGWAAATDRGLVLVAVDGTLAGAVATADHVRPEARDLIASLRAAGIRHVGMLTGDRADVAEDLARRLGIDRVETECSPEDKVAAVRATRATPGLAPVVMVGDGINDAPALAAADVGVALGAVTGATVASETADAVITVDRVDRVAEALRISRRSLAIARQSVLAGMGLSLVAMALAGFGLIPPVEGAILQEGIDVAVILNALRVLRGPSG